MIGNDTSTHMLPMQTIIAVSADQASTNLGEEVAILNVRTGVYYGLREVGQRVWELLQQPRSLAEVRDEILAEYDVEQDICEADLQNLVSSLLESGLVEIRSQAA